MRYLDIIQIINENRQQYLQMLQPLVQLGLWSSEQAQQFADEVRQKLKRNDRIVWYIKWSRALQIYKAVKAFNTTPDQKSQLKQDFKKVTGMEWWENYDELEYFHRQLIFGSPFVEHLLSRMQEIPNLETMQWAGTPMDLAMQIDQIEQAHAQKAKRSVTPGSDDKILINYGNSAWFLLPRGACEDEGDAMGHCGNVPSQKPGDRILSYREQVRGGKWKPYLTFILDKSGMLGEMKGFANEKPAKEYHKVIVDLLKNPIVTGIIGGGYAPDQNFALKDLSSDQQEELIKDKPGLAGIVELYRAKGFIEPVRQAIDTVLADNGMAYDDIKDGTVYIDSTTSLSEFFSRFDISNLDIVTLIYAIANRSSIENGNDDTREGFYDTYLEGSDLEEEIADVDHWKEIIRRLPSDTVDELAEYLRTDTHNLYNAFMADNILNKIYHTATKDAMIDGTLSNMMKIFQQWLVDNQLWVQVQTQTRAGYPMPVYSYVMPLDDLVNSYEELQSSSDFDWTQLAKIEDARFEQTPMVVDYQLAADNLRYWVNHQIFKKF